MATETNFIHGTTAAVKTYVVGHDDPQKHMASTYFCLRLGMTVLGLLAPFIIVGWGRYWGANWESSLSAYYFSPGNGKEWIYSNYPGRVPFVGILFALGFSLWAYKGFTRWENFFLNLAGICAIFVAVFPIYAEERYISFSRTVHFISAAGLFTCMSIVAIFYSKDSLTENTDPVAKTRYRRFYFWIGVFMLLFPVVGYLVALLAGSAKDYVLYIEFLGIEIFALFWGVKTYELRSMEVDIKALKGQLPAQKEEAASA